MELRVWYSAAGLAAHGAQIQVVGAKSSKQMRRSTQPSLGTWTGLLAYLCSVFLQIKVSAPSTYCHITLQGLGQFPPAPATQVTCKCSA